MATQCNAEQFLFEGLGGRECVASFDGGRVSSDAGVVILREVDGLLALTKRFAACFTDHRNQDLIEHDVESIVSQRVFGIALGYEDVSDHDELRADPLFAAVCGKKDVEGAKRRRERDRGNALAAKNTLSRMELTKAGATKDERYKKVDLREQDVDQLLVDVFVESFGGAAPAEVEIDLDATDAPLHGAQEGRHFHGYYGHYCYLPLYAFCGEHLLLARLGTADKDPGALAAEELPRLVARLRRHWPEVKVIVRGDSGFCRDALMAWCEKEDHFFVLGLAKNARLEEEVAEELARAKELCAKEGRPVRFFKDFDYRTLDSWSRTRRVVGKAEHLVGDKSNPRFIVTNLPRGRWTARQLYEDVYCARGDMENRIKEQQLGLFADRLSTPTIRGNQTRLYFSSVAYVLMHGLRRLGLKDTDLSRAQCSTIRLKLLKIGAVLKVSVRRIWVSMSSAFAAKEVFAAALRNLRAAAPPAAA